MLQSLLCLHERRWRVCAQAIKATFCHGEQKHDVATSQGVSGSAVRMLRRLVCNGCNRGDAATAPEEHECTGYLVSVLKEHSATDSAGVGGDEVSRRTSKLVGSDTACLMWYMGT
jgi:hypothetical protein